MKPVVVHLPPVASIGPAAPAVYHLQGSDGPLVRRVLANVDGVRTVEAEHADGGVDGPEQRLVALGLPQGVVRLAPVGPVVARADAERRGRLGRLFDDCAELGDELVLREPLLAAPSVDFEVEKLSGAKKSD